MKKQKYVSKHKVSIWTTSELFGKPVKYEGYLISHKLVDYAQYKSVPEVIFTPKGKRNPVRLIKGYQPFILILDGWNLPNWDNDIVEQSGVFTVTKSKYTSHDVRHKLEFNAWFEKQKCDIVADYRYTTATKKEISREEVADVFYNEDKLEELYEGEVPKSLTMADVRTKMEEKA